MIAFAICDGCGRRVESTTVPKYWLRVSRKADTEPRLFCTMTCLAETDGLSTAQIRAYCARKYLLTPRDQTIVRHIARGKSNAEIGQALGLAESTIKNRLLDFIGPRLGASSRLEIVLVADRVGMIDLREESAKIKRRFPPPPETASETEEAPDHCINPDHPH